MIRPLYTAALSLAFLASCANYAAPPMHQAQAIGLRLPLPVFDLDAEGSVSTFPLGDFTYDLDFEQSGVGLDWETSLSEEGEWTWVTGVQVAKYDVEAQGVRFDGDAVLLTTGPRYYFSIDSAFQPFMAASVSYSPELDLDGNDYGAFATLNLGGGMAWFPTMNFAMHVGLDWVETIVEPDFNELAFTGTTLFSVKDEISFTGLQMWIGGSFWF